MKDPIPRQQLLETSHVQLINMDRYIHELSRVSHRHDHYMIMWITKGHGSQLIDQREYEMVTNRVFFVHPSQVHQMNDFERDGWLIIFDETIYQLFTRFHPLEERNGIMRSGGQQPFVDLDAKTAYLFGQVINMILQELSAAIQDCNMLSHYISILLLAANQLYVKEKAKEKKNPNDVKKLMRNLDRLIERNYKNRLPVSFYADALHMQSRNLNMLVKKESGYTVHDLIEEKLLTESKILLASSALTVKEISYDLGFADPAYFNRFFRKLAGITPAAFRNRAKKTS